MPENENSLFKGKTEQEINEFLTLEGELIVELDKLSTPTKRAILENLHAMAKLPDWMRKILLEDINTAVTNRIDTMKMIVESYRVNRPFSRQRTARDIACEREKET
jgi:hypothetical protein